MGPQSPIHLERIARSAIRKHSLKPTDARLAVSQVMGPVRTRVFADVAESVGRRHPFAQSSYVQSSNRQSHGQPRAQRDR